MTITSARILLLQNMAWETIPFQQVFQMVPQLDQFKLDILFGGAPAVRFYGPSVPFVGVLLYYLLYRKEVSLPALGTR
jgi:hypothetical protein